MEPTQPEELVVSDPFSSDANPGDGWSGQGPADSAPDSPENVSTPGAGENQGAPGDSGVNGPAPSPWAGGPGASGFGSPAGVAAGASGAGGFGAGGFGTGGPSVPPPTTPPPTTPPASTPLPGAQPAGVGQPGAVPFGAPPGGQVPGGQVPGGQVPGGQFPGGQMASGQVPGSLPPAGIPPSGMPPSGMPPGQYPGSGAAMGGGYQPPVTPYSKTPWVILGIVLLLVSLCAIALSFFVDKIEDFVPEASQIESTTVPIPGDPTFLPSEIGSEAIDSGSEVSDLDDVQGDSTHGFIFDQHQELTRKPAGEVSIGGGVKGEIKKDEAAAINLNLNEKQTVTINVDAEGFSDLALWIFDGQGKVVGFKDDNDEEIKLTPKLTFTAPKSGTYTLLVGGLDTSTSKYNLTVNE